MDPLARDDSGNSLLSLRFSTESEVDTVECSLIVVRLGSEVLLVFDAWRRQWEIPGGRLDPGESPDDAAARELAEETGIAGVPLVFRAIAEFDLRGRRELGAVYATRLRETPRLTVNDEISAFRWWHPESSIDPGQSPIDAEIARRVR